MDRQTVQAAPAPIAGSGGEWRRHGTVVIPSMGGMMLVAVHGYSLGVMMGPLERAFGWSRAEISSGNLIIAIVAVLISPLIGLAIDRFGPRLVAIVGVIVYSVLVANFATVSGDIASWWLRWGLLGIGSASITATVWAAAINSRFDVHRGKALAIALLGTGLSAAFIPALTNALVERLDWRDAYLALAVIFGGIELLLVLLFFRGATDLPGARARGATILPQTGMTAHEGFRSPAFRKLALAVLVFAITCLALTVNAVPVLEARGLTQRDAAAVAGLLGIGSILGRLGGGFLLDRFDASRVAAISVAVPIAAIAMLLALPGSDLAAGTAMLLLGLALGTEVDACSYLAARHFGMRAFGSLFGTINGVVIFGSGAAPVVANYVYDVAGSYDPVLYATIPLCALAALLFASLGPYPQFDDQAPEPLAPIADPMVAA